MLWGVMGANTTVFKKPLRHATQLCFHGPNSLGLPFTSEKSISNLLILKTVLNS